MALWLGAFGASLFAGVYAALAHRPLALIVSAVTLLLLTFVVRPKDLS